MLPANYDQLLTDDMKEVEFEVKEDEKVTKCKDKKVPAL